MTYQRKYATLITLLLAAACTALMPTRALAACDATTIAGNYGFRQHRLELPPASPSAALKIGSLVPDAFAGQIVFTASATDSASGTISFFREGNEGGLVVLVGGIAPTTIPGTYSVAPDCTGTLTQVFPSGGTEQYEIAIVQGGAEIRFANTVSSSGVFVGGGVAKKQLGTCSAATIAGDYGVEFNSLFAPPGKISLSTFELGAFIPGEFAGLFVFDSTTTPPSVSGHVAGNSGGLEKITSSFTGTYLVNPNCTGTLHRVLPDGETRDYELAIVDGGAEIEFANTTSSPNQIVGEGVMKR